MSSSQHDQYLRAMGVQTWSLKHVAQIDEADQIDEARHKNQTAVTADAVTATTDPSPDAPPPVIAKTKAAVNEHVTADNNLSKTPSIKTRKAGDNWTQLRRDIETCNQCRRAETRKKAIVGHGNPQARWLIINEALSLEEEQAGRPFVGESGDLLDNMLKAMKLDREQVYSTNTLKCAPIDQHKPRTDEITACRHYLERQIQLVQPTLILALGLVAANTLLDNHDTIATMRGQTFYYGKQKIPVIVSYHPGYLIRSPSEKRKAWQDLQAAMHLFDALNKT